MSENLKVVESSVLVADSAAIHPGVEVWPDNYVEDGWEYFSVMSAAPPAFRKLAYVRVKAGSLQRRVYDAKGDDLWLQAN